MPKRCDAIIHELATSLIVSCQPVPDGPFDRPDLVIPFVKAAEQGGAKAVRIEGLANLKAVRQATDLPIIGLIKRPEEGTDVYITPTLNDVAVLAAAGADIIAFDATHRARPFPAESIIAAIHELGCCAMADIATLNEGLAAFHAGAEFVGTTLSGYTANSPQQQEPDFELIRALSARGVRVIAEGRISHPFEAERARKEGAYAVTVGTAITRPEWITRSFVEAVQRPGVKHS
jgi:putative N-acetylmannosamine-6-phosphate epimerase